MKISMPNRVREKYEELRAQHKNIYISKINNRFYLYKVAYIDQGQGKSKLRSSEYFGRITEQGAFIKRSATNEEKELEEAMAIVRSHGIQFEIQKQKEEGPPMQGGTELIVPTVTQEEAKILTILSMNGRARMKSIGKLLGVSAQAAARKVRALEQKYDLRYTVEIDPNKLGFREYLVLIKFTDKMPTIKEIEEAFRAIPMVQFCAIVKGEYDLLLYILADISMHEEEAARLDDLRFEVLRNYKSVWHWKSVYTVYGFIPLREEFFKMLEERIWRKGAGTRGQPRNFIYERDYKVLKALSENGKKSYQDIDKDNGLPQGSARYSYYKLLESDTLKRVTICENNLPISYNGIIQFNRVDIPAFENSRNSFRMDVISNPLTANNRYTVIFDVGDPDGVLLITPVFKNENLNKRLDKLRGEVQGVDFNSSMTGGVVIGSLCYRKFDNSYSIQYRNLVKNKVIKQEEKVPYMSF